MAEFQDAETFESAIEIFNTRVSDATQGGLMLWGGMTIYNTNPSTFMSAGGALTVLGGMSLLKNSMFGGNVSIFDSTVASPSISTGSLVTLGGIGVGQNVNIGGTVDSTSICSGSLIVNGGVGIQKSLNVAKKFDVSSYQTGTSSTTGQYVSIRPSEFRDSNALANTTVPNVVFNSIDIPTISATNANIRVSNATTFYIKGSPTPGVNVSLSNGYSMVVDGNTKLQNLEVTGIMNVFGTINNTQDTYVYDLKSQGTNGGDFIKNAWRTRDINTISSVVGGVTISGINTLTLSPGSYNVSICCPSYNVEGNKIRLYNVTTSTEALIGSSSFSKPTSNTQSWIFGILNVSVSSDFVIQHYSETSRTDTGFGRSTGIDANELYTVACFKRISTTPQISQSSTDTYIYDLKTQGTNGGDFFKNAWRTRVLNTISSTSGGVSLSGNVMTIAPGNYNVFSRVPSYHVESNKARLYNVTDSTSDITGTSSYSTQSDNNTWLIGRISPLISTNYRIEHYCEKDRVDTGFGRATGISNELYTTVYIKKV